MIIIINKPEELVRVLKNVVGVSEVNQTMPVLSNVLIEADIDGLHFTGTDLEVQIKNTYPLPRTEDGVKTTLPAKKLLDIVQALSNHKEITFDIEDQKTTISAGKSELVLPSLPANDFPVMQTQTTEDKAISKIKAGELLTSLSETSFCMAYQDARHFLNGLFFEKKNNETVFVSTDGHRLALSKCPGEHAEANPNNCIIPRKCVMELKRILATFKDISQKLIEFSYDNKQIHFNVEGHDITSKLIEGTFPDYNKVFPEELPNKLLVEKNEFKQHLSVMSQVANEKYKGVKLTITANELLLTSTKNIEQNQGKGKTSIACEYTGENLEIGFNLSYLLETIDVISTDNVLIQIKNSEGGCLISSTDETPKNKYVIMPMRV